MLAEAENQHFISLKQRRENVQSFSRFQELEIFEIAIVLVLVCGCHHENAYA